MNFLFDENMPAPLARALRELGEPVRHVLDIEELGGGTTDDVLIRYAARWGYRLISRDKAMLKPSQLKALIHAEGIGMYVARFGKARAPDKWDLYKAVIRLWPSIVRHAGENEPPYVMQFGASGSLKPLRG